MQPGDLEELKPAGARALLGALLILSLLGRKDKNRKDLEGNEIMWASLCEMETREEETGRRDKKKNKRKKVEEGSMIREWKREERNRGEKEGRQSKG